MGLYNHKRRLDPKIRDMVSEYGIRVKDLSAVCQISYATLYTALCNNSAMQDSTASLLESTIKKIASEKKKIFDEIKKSIG